MTYFGLFGAPGKERERLTTSFPTAHRSCRLRPPRARSALPKRGTRLRRGGSQRPDASCAHPDTPGSIQKVEPPILDSNTPQWCRLQKTKVDLLFGSFQGSARPSPTSLGSKLQVRRGYGKHGLFYIIWAASATRRAWPWGPQQPPAPTREQDLYTNEHASIYLSCTLGV